MIFFPEVSVKRATADLGGVKNLRAIHRASDDLEYLAHLRASAER
jgi:hypothetical protein